MTARRPHSVRRDVYSYRSRANGPYVWLWIPSWAEETEEEEEEATVMDMSQVPSQFDATITVPITTVDVGGGQTIRVNLADFTDDMGSPLSISWPQPRPDPAAVPLFDPTRDANGNLIANMPGCTPPL